MSDIEDFIKQNRAQFQDAEPTDGHAERFLKKLEREEHHAKTSVFTFWRIAAAIIVLAVISISVLLPRFNSPEQVQYASMSLSDVSSELADVELYYQSKLEQEYERLNEMSQTDPEVEAYMDELERLNDLYANLEGQLYESGSHEKVVIAMIENFRLRLALIEKLEAKKNLEMDETSYEDINKKSMRKSIKKSVKMRKKKMRNLMKTRRASMKTIKQTKILRS